MRKGSCPCWRNEPARSQDGSLNWACGLCSAVGRLELAAGKLLRDHPWSSSCDTVEDDKLKKEAKSSEKKPFLILAIASPITISNVVLLFSVLIAVHVDFEDLVV